MPELIRTGRRTALLSVGYAVAGYLLTLGVLVYTFGFLARWGVPKNIDSAAGTGWPAAVAIDAALLLLFAVQHTVMARAGFKRRSARVFGAHAEREQVAGYRVADAEQRRSTAGSDLLGHDSTLWSARGRRYWQKHLDRHPVVAL